MSGPAPDLATAQRLLSALAGAVPEGLNHCVIRASAAGWEPKTLASWLAAQGLGPLAYHHFKERCPDLAVHLREDAFSAAAENSLHFRDLERVLDQLAKAEIPVVLLKGAALAREVYGDIALRTMSDVDLWLQSDQMPRAARVMQQLGFQAWSRDRRPPELQQLSGGELQFYNPQRPRGLVELHWSPFPGWWLRRTAAVDNERVWARCQPRPAWGHGEMVRCLSPEDMVIQLAVHLAINSALAPPFALRGMMDIALTARTTPVDWETVLERAGRWRLATVLWWVLGYADRLMGLPGLGDRLKGAAPGRPRQVLLAKLLPLESLLAGRDLRGTVRRYLMLLLLVDRPGDAFRLAFRALWPESEWLAARYGGQVGRWGHLWRLLRRRRV